MKIAPILEEASGRERLDPVLLHTGQHYDETMSDAFFRDLGLPSPDVHLGVGSEASPVIQIARIMERFDPEIRKIAPSCVVVVGDVEPEVEG